VKIAVKEVPAGGEEGLVIDSPFHEVDNVAPTKLLPVKVTGPLQPGGSLAGFIAVTIGALLFVTSNVNVVCPPVAVSVTVALPTLVVEAMLKVAEAQVP
jgi:hypothetical protein